MKTAFDRNLVDGSSAQTGAEEGAVTDSASVKVHVTDVIHHAVMAISHFSLPGLHPVHTQAIAGMILSSILRRYAFITPTVGPLVWLRNALKYMTPEPKLTDAVVVSEAFKDYLQDAIHLSLSELLMPAWEYAHAQARNDTMPISNDPLTPTTRVGLVIAEEAERVQSVIADAMSRSLYIGDQSIADKLAIIPWETLSYDRVSWASSCTYDLTAVRSVTQMIESIIACYSTIAMTIDKSVQYRPSLVALNFAYTGSRRTFQTLPMRTFDATIHPSSIAQAFMTFGTPQVFDARFRFWARVFGVNPDLYDDYISKAAFSSVRELVNEGMLLKRFIARLSNLTLLQLSENAFAQLHDEALGSDSGESLKTDLKNRKTELNAAHPLLAAIRNAVQKPEKQ